MRTALEWAQIMALRMAHAQAEDENLLVGVMVGTIEEIQKDVRAELDLPAKEEGKT